MKIKTLIQASAAVDAATQHILLHVTAEGKLFASGTDNKVKAIVGEIELYEKIKTCINHNLTTENVGYGNTQSWLTIFSTALPFVFLSLVIISKTYKSTALATLLTEDFICLLSSWL